MRIVLAAALGIGMASGAGAQSDIAPLGRASHNARQAELSYQGLGDPRTGPAAATASTKPAIECLTRKSDGQRVCHSRHGWREVARNLERGEVRGR